MKNKLLTSLLILSAFTPCIPVVAFADGPIIQSSTSVKSEAFEQDRRDILSMAGNYRVRFDMRETTPWQASYSPIEPKISGGYESVRVIEDTGNKIILQHLLVVDMEDGSNHVIKHWRQDWQYEPLHVLVYRGTGRWALEEVPERMRTGRWSQTVYQVDDSPRYGGWGQFETQAGIRRWRSNWTWRPLARRDAVRHPVYDRYYSINRHQLTPNGWIHWQDNTKMGMIDGQLTAIVQETVLNTYTKFDGYNIAAADDYWNKTKDYWAAVRTFWGQVASRDSGINVLEEAETGTVKSAQLLEYADELSKGKITLTSAISNANNLIFGIDDGHR